MKLARWLSNFVFLFCLSFVPLFLEAMPVITSLSSNHAPAGVSVHEIDIRGTGFTGTPEVHFGSALATILEHNNDTAIRVRVPRGAVSTVAVTVTTGGETSAVSAASYFAYRGDWLAYFTDPSGRLIIVNTRTHAMTGYVPLPVELSGSIAITPDGSTAFVGAREDQSILLAIDLTDADHTYTIIRKAAFTGGHGGLAIAPDGQTVYAVIGDTLFPVDVKDHTLGTPIQGLGEPFGIAITPDGTTAYVADQGSPQIIPITLSTGAKLSPIETEAPNLWATLQPNGHNAYFTNIGVSFITQLKLATHDLNEISIPRAGDFIAMDPDGSRVFIAATFRDMGEVLASVLYLVNDVVPRALVQGGVAGGVMFTPDGKQAYFATQNMNKVALYEEGVPPNISQITLLPGFVTRFVAITPDPAPIALFRAQRRLSTLSVDFDASRSISPVGEIVEYIWDFGDGSPLGSGVSPVHTYAKAGVYTVTLTVKNTAGTSLTKKFTGQTMSQNGGPSAQSQALVVAGEIPPIIDSITPPGGPASGGSRVVIRGKNFIGPPLQVSIGSQLNEDDVILVSGEEIIAITPPLTGPPPLQRQVVVITRFGDSHSGDVVEFHYLTDPPKPPSVTSLRLNVGPGSRESTVTIQGTNFEDLPRPVPEVFFGDGIAKEVKRISPLLLTAVAPPISEKSGEVQVVVSTRGGSSETSSASSYTYQSAPPNIPVISAILPNGGPTGGRSILMIKGENFFGTPLVYFDGVLGTNITLIDSTTIVVTSPSGTGLADVIVTTEGGGNSETSTFTYLSPSPPAPRIAPVSENGLDPAVGVPEGGELIVINGNNFATAGGAQVYFGNLPAESVRVIDNTRIEARSPPGRGSVIVRVTTRGGTSNGEFFMYAPIPPAPRIDSLDPSFGGEEGGTLVIIRGNNFNVPGRIRVYFGENLAESVVVSSNTRIEARSPPGVGPVPVKVITRGGASNSLLFIYLSHHVDLPKVLEVDPSSGPDTGDSLVVIDGENFGGLEKPVPEVFFGGVSATPVTRDSPTRLTVRTPPGIGEALVTVKTEVGESEPPPSVHFTYLSGVLTPHPEVSHIAPSNGVAGDEITIKGDHFKVGDEVVVFFGTTPAEQSTALSDTVIRARVPREQSTSRVHVKVTTMGGTSAVSSADEFTYISALFPPENAQGEQYTNQFAYQKDIINKMTWTAPIKGKPPVAYKIYKDAALKKLLGVVSARSKKPYSFTQHNRRKNRQYTYYIVSVDEKGNKSQAAIVKIK